MVHPDALRYRAVRHYKDARENTFDGEFDRDVDGYLDYLREVAPQEYEALSADIDRT
jgi:hypothetical protein